MSASALYGPLVSRNHVAFAVRDTLKDYMPSWLGEVRRRYAYPTAFPMPKSWLLVDEITDEPLGRTPLVLMTVRGMPDGLQAGGDTETGVWAVALACFVEAKSKGATGLTSTAQEQSGWLAGEYGAVIRAVLKQQGDLGGLAAGVAITSETYDDLGPGSEGRQYASARLTFDVTVSQVVDSHAGPDTPPDDPDETPTDALIEHTALTVTRQ
jgi:hypothetical protein